MLENYCNEKGWSIYKIYTDEDYSGVRSDRPAFNEMLCDAENKKFQVVLCKTMSRFSRDMSVVENYINNKFGELGIRFISVVDNTDSYDKKNKKTRQLNSLINEWYLEDLSDNIRAVFKDKMKKGECLFAFAPYGYRKDKLRKNHLVPDDEVTDIVKRIYWLYNFGYGIKTIAGILNAENVISPLNYRNNVKKSNWTSSSVADILKNPVYTGDLVQNRKNKLSYKSKKRVAVSENEWISIPDTHIPLVERRIYNQTKKTLKMASRCGKNGKLNPFAGKIYCKCGKKCIIKNNIAKCEICAEYVYIKELVELVCGKLKMEKNEEVLFPVITTTIQKIVLGDETITIVWDNTV